MKGIIGFTLLMFITVASFAQETLKSGSWTEKKYSIDGTWSLVKTGNEVKVILSDNFKTKSAPDLKIFLSKKSSNELKSGNATKDSAFVSKLKNAKGRQEYVIPSSINLSDYQTILIHCEEYSVLWGVASIN